VWRKLETYSRGEDRNQLAVSASEQTRLHQWRKRETLVDDGLPSDEGTEQDKG
jgi:hypothetical protein